MIALLAFLRTKILLPMWLVVTMLGGLLVIAITAVVLVLTARAAFAKVEAEHAQYVAQVEIGAREASERYRKLEQYAASSVQGAMDNYRKEMDRANELEASLSAAILRGERRVRPSICAASRSVPGSAAGTGGTAGGADDGARHLASAVRAGAKADAKLRLCRDYVKATQAMTR